MWEPVNKVILKGEIMHHLLIEWIPLIVILLRL